MDANDLRRAKRASGLLLGKPVEIRPGEDFAVTVTTPIPPLHRPHVEIMVEELQLKDTHGDVVEVAFRASPNEREVRVGDVTVELRKGLSAVADYKDAAVQKLCSLIGQAVAQAYVSLMVSGDCAQEESARTMEIGH